MVFSGMSMCAVISLTRKSAPEYSRKGLDPFPMNLPPFPCNLYMCPCILYLLGTVRDIVMLSCCHLRSCFVKIESPVAYIPVSSASLSIDRRERKEKHAGKRNGTAAANQDRNRITQPALSEKGRLAFYRPSCSRIEALTMRTYSYRGSVTFEINATSEVLTYVFVLPIQFAAINIGATLQIRFCLHVV
jgi:hypothetical protein